MPVPIQMTGDRCIKCYSAMAQSHKHGMLLAKLQLILLQSTGVLRSAERQKTGFPFGQWTFIS